MMAAVTMQFTGRRSLGALCRRHGAARRGALARFP